MVRLHLAALVTRGRQASVLRAPAARQPVRALAESCKAKEGQGQVEQGQGQVAQGQVEQGQEERAQAA